MAGVSEQLPASIVQWLQLDCFNFYSTGPRRPLYAGSTPDDFMQVL